MSNPRIVITGSGPVSAAGLGYDELVASILELSFRAADGPCHVPEFDLEDYLDTTKAYLDRGSELVLAAAALAIDDAGLDLETLDRERTGLLLGSSFGAFETMALFYSDLATKGPRFAKPFLFPHTYSNTAISLVALEYGLTGPHLNFSSGNVSSSIAILQALDMLRDGHIVVALAGGYESLCSGLHDTSGTSVPGEGAAIVVLEPLDSAVAREAIVHAELLGGGLTSGGTPEDAVQNSMELALNDAGIEPTELGGIVASGAGATALAGMHGERLPVLDITHLTGDTKGASGALQLAAALTMVDSVVIPRILALNISKATVDLVANPTLLVNALDQGGSAVSLVIRIGDIAS